jgi:uncharacterized LabA/DUF88 family protein
MSKAVVLIDGGYLNKVLENVFGRPPFSYEKFADILCSKNNCERIRTYYYNCPPYQSNPPTHEESIRVADFDKFIRYWKEKSQRFEPRLGRLQKIGQEFKQKHVDVYLSVDLVRLACKGAIDKAIIVSGDSDFVPAVKVAKDEGIVTILYYSKTHPMYVHYELLGACDEKNEITQELMDQSRP